MADLSLKAQAGLLCVQCTETAATDSQSTLCDKQHDQFSHVLAPPEYVGPDHPRNKIESQPNKSNPKKGRGRPPTHGLSRTPIYNSHRDAKSRCEDTKDSDYPNYGGRGIKYLFKSVAELHAAIGDRPENQTLDRIDPDGNYEAGNVRWATPKEQAKNRRPADFYAARARSLGWNRTSESRAAYEQTAKHWSLSIKCVNEVSLSSAEMSFLEERHDATSLPFATYWKDRELNAHHVMLPALNGGSKCVVRVGPTVTSANSSFTQRGLLEGTNTIELRANCTSEEVAIVNTFVKDFRGNGQSGLVYSNIHEINDNRIEGRLLAAAGRLMSLNLPSRVVLASELAGTLSINVTEPFLRREYLFLPDLKRWSEVFGCDRIVTSRLREVLCERERSRLPTVIYVGDSLELGPDFHSIFALRYVQANLSKVSALNHQVNGHCASSQGYCLAVDE